MCLSLCITMFLSLPGTSKRFSPAEDTPKSEVEKEVPSSHQQKKADKTPWFQETHLVNQQKMLMKYKLESKKSHTCNLIQKNIEMMKWIFFLKRKLHYLSSTKNWWKNLCCLESFHPSPTPSSPAFPFVNPLHASRLLERTCNTFERGKLEIAEKR